jgi:hypothetical protein
MKSRKTLQTENRIEIRGLQDHELDVVAGGAPGCSLVAPAPGPSADREHVSFTYQKIIWT